jgi:glycosyltransferase involved in cell wall biosynthesis
MTLAPAPTPESVRRLKIVVACQLGGTNGIETYTRYLVRSLEEAGHEVLVAHRLPQLIDSNGAGGTDPMSPGRLKPDARLLRRLVGPFEGVRVLGALGELARSAGADVIHATYPEFTTRSGPPVVATAWHPETRVFGRLRSAHERMEGRWTEGLFALSDRLAFRKASGIIALSGAVQRSLRDSQISSVRIPPFVPDALIRPAARQRRAECVMVARWLDAPRKRLPLAVEAVREVRKVRRDVRLRLIGGWLDERSARDLPDFCEPVGLLDRDVLASRLRGAGCLLLPSAFEEFGYVGLEALAAGVPIVCGPLAGYRDLAGNGIVLANSPDAAGLAHAVLDAIERDEFEFPGECRASAAVSRIIDLYEHVARDGSTYR